jgi:hypothetical protein
MTKDADFKKHVRARMARTGEAYTTARAHLLQRKESTQSRSTGGARDAGANDGDARSSESEARSAASASRTSTTDIATLHITNGDSAGGSLRETNLPGAGVPGGVLAWRDVLHEGPVPDDLPEAELRAVRARALAERWHLDERQVLADLTARDGSLERHQEGELVLWFEADLYDQLQLIQVLAMLRGLGVDPSHVSLICIGEYPEIAHFGGLGELQPGQLVQLYPRREPLEEETLGLATEAWNAFRSEDPRSLTDIDRWTSRRLRFLAEAFLRLAQEFPWRSDGLSLTQRRILASVAGEPLSMPQVFRQVWRKERRPYLGDLSCFSTIHDLASAPHPLLAYRDRGPGDPPAAGQIELTEAGKQVLAGSANHVALNGIDRWIGGVHLRPGRPAWRYDERLEVLVVE